MSDADYAVIVGIDRYPQLGENRTELSLKGPGHDADAIEAWFKEQNVHIIAKIKGSIVDGLARPTGDQIEAAMRRIDNMALINQADKKGLQVGRRLYIYMSGHGFSPARRRGCIFTADADDRFGNNIHVSSWLDWFQDAGYFREFVLWMDCCMDRISLLPPREPQVRPQASRTPPNGVFIAFAAQRPLRTVEAPIPQDGDKWHGVFTWALLEGLRGAAVDANGFVTSRSLADWLRNAQSHFLGAGDLRDPQVSKEPDIQEDSRLIFARGVSPKTYPVSLAFDVTVTGKQARLWCGRPPKPETIDTGGGTPKLLLRPGLYVVDVPDAQIRQGFEVVGPTEITIRESGTPVKLAKQGQVFTLQVAPPEQPAEIFVIDTVFSLVDAMPGRLTSPLSFGLYKIKVRVGNQVKERVILLDGDRPAIDAGEIAPVIAAAAPISKTALGHEYQEAAALAASRKARGLAVDRDRPVLTVMVRAWSDNDTLPRSITPWDGIHVIDGRGKVVLDLSRDGERRTGTSQDPYAVAMAALKSGVYFFRRPMRNGTKCEQTLVLTRGWNLEAYYLCPGSADAERRHSMFSLHMRRSGDGDPDPREDRLIEAACTALAYERYLLAGELQELLLRNFSNPIAGIVGAHLFVLQAERSAIRDLSLLNEVVGKLRDLVGDDHPDVEALSVKCPDSSLRPRVPVKQPPIFRRSWQLLTEATQQQRTLVPASVWKRVHAFTPRPLYLTWVADAEIKQASLEALAKAVWEEPSPTRAPPTEATSISAEMALERLPVNMSVAAAVERNARQTEERVLVEPKIARERALRLQVPLSVLNSLRQLNDSPEAPTVQRDGMRPLASSQ